MELRALTWNLFHGRDDPPNPALRSWRSRLLRTTEHDATHSQVNRDLFAEFARLLVADDWDVALLQECPPRWSAPLAEATGARAHRVLTSRNSLAPLRALVARLNPDLIASNEGGSNLTLVRRRDRRPTRARAQPGPEAGAASDGLHPSDAGRARDRGLRRQPPRQRRPGPARRSRARGPRRRQRACEWAGDTPLVFGGDLNLRPRETDAFDHLAERFGLRQATAPGSLDHLLVAGLEIAVAPAPWAPERREVAAGGRAIRLSDHAPVQATFVAARPDRVPHTSRT